MTDVNCGLKPKEGQRRGTAKECLDKGQVRYYGIKKIDKSLLKIPNIEKMKQQATLLDIEIRGLEKRFGKEKEVLAKVKQKRKGQKSKEAKEDIEFRKKPIRKTIKQHATAKKKMEKLKAEYQEAKRDLEALKNE